MPNFDHIASIVLLLCAGIFAALALHYYGCYEDLKLEVKAAGERAELMKQQAEFEYEQKLKAAEVTAEGKLKDVQDHYNQLVSSLRDDLGRMRDKDNHQNQPAATAGTACRPCTARPSKSPRPDGGAAERAEYLESELLAVSRDCDALAVRFNTLLELYQSYQSQTNERLN